MENLTEYSENEIPNDDGLETHSKADEDALLNEITEQDFNPDEAVAKTDPKEAAALAAGEATSMAVIGVTEEVIRQFVHKDFMFDEAQVKGVAGAAAPLFVKYGGELPPWLVQYKEELTFVMAAGALGFSSYHQVKELKALDRAKEIQAAKEDGAPDHAAD
ncbi:hypothetical protein VR7878_04000 [Vibrio ruber DSM 16370]|uniref:Uncharacterized protein n=1 Tax=Vibrio ruber (strain DSM 16370 / JCM 11486 / BCRC 17186 / CECT 7878 / LMG 23124 / VR1) TaxID=1123498 RepID=A0A1R4LU28_VIBR1|nr:hypothetical protein [Vibrio ruber]SJN60052.1 hypothetical protein VR7878_03956 [Vibrio ruber DSM 16370]SJN60096.1 hypothetical protein VR7878_04000 [Vibrio ruber DSM 16370]